MFCYVIIKFVVYFFIIIVLDFFCSVFFLFVQGMLKSAS